MEHLKNVKKWVFSGSSLKIYNVMFTNVYPKKCSFTTNCFGLLKPQNRNKMGLLTKQ